MNLTIKLLGLDFESTDDKPETTYITEIGAILVEVSKQANPGIDFYYPKYAMEKFCWEFAYPPQTTEIAALTGITDTMLRTHGISRQDAFAELLPLVEEADIIVAHNKKFDQTVFESTCGRLGIVVPKKTWLCTLTEIPYPEKYTCKKLSHLAWEHDIAVDRSALHRATYDVELMLKLLAKYELTKVLEYAQEPWVYLQALFPAPWHDGGVGKAKAQKLGFGWEKARGDDRVFAKQWVARVKKSQVGKAQERAEKLQLNIQIIE